MSCRCCNFIFPRCRLGSRHLIVVVGVVWCGVGWKLEWLLKIAQLRSFFRVFLSLQLRQTPWNQLPMATKLSATASRIITSQGVLCTSDIGQKLTRHTCLPINLHVVLLQGFHHLVNYWSLHSQLPRRHTYTHTRCLDGRRQSCRHPLPYQHLSCNCEVKVHDSRQRRDIKLRSAMG